MQCGAMNGIPHCTVARTRQPHPHARTGIAPKGSAHGKATAPTKSDRTVAGALLAHRRISAVPITAVPTGARTNASSAACSGRSAAE